MKSLEGKVIRSKVSDTGDPREDYDYLIGGDYLSRVIDEVERSEGRRIRITIEDLPDEVEEDDEEEPFYD